MMVRIEYFLKGKSLGKFTDLKNMSNQDDRDLHAHWNGIKDYDEFIIDDGRVHCRKMNGRFFKDSKERMWEILNP